MRLPRDHGVRFPDGAAFVAGSLQGFVRDFCPELLQFERRCLVHVSFGVIRCPGHLISLLQLAGVSKTVHAAALNLHEIGKALAACMQPLSVADH